MRVGSNENGSGDPIEILFCIESGHAAEPGGCDCLAINVICNVARSKNSRDAGGRGVALQAADGGDIAAAHIELAFKNIRVRRVPDRNKNAGDIETFFLGTVGALDERAGYPVRDRRRLA